MAGNDHTKHDGTQHDGVQYDGTRYDVERHARLASDPLTTPERPVTIST